MNDHKRLPVRVISYVLADDHPLLAALAEVLSWAALDTNEAADVALRVLAPSGWVGDDPNWYRAAAGDDIPVLFRRWGMPEDTYITFCFWDGQIRSVSVKTWFASLEADEIIAKGPWKQVDGYWQADDRDKKYIAECDPLAWAREIHNYSN